MFKCVENKKDDFIVIFLKTKLVCVSLSNMEQRERKASGMYHTGGVITDSPADA